MEGAGHVGKRGGVEGEYLGGGVQREYRGKNQGLSFQLLNLRCLLDIQEQM